jgi:DNA-binding protein YbaB
MFGNISQILEMKKKADELKAKLETIQVTEEFKGITVDCNGNRKILAIHVPEQLMGNKAELEDNLAEAINKALAAAEKASIGDLASMAGGLQGLSGMLGK